MLTALVVGLAVLAQDRARLEVLGPLALVAGGVLFWLWRRNDVAMGEVLLYALLFRLVLVLLPPSLSDDAYRYVWDGLVQVQGFNPYQYTPDDPALSTFHRDPIYEDLNSKSYYTVYPPVSQGVFAFGALFYGNGWLYSYYVIKLVLVLLELCAVFLLARMVEARWVMLYAWNPLVLLETAGQAHTESAMLFFLVVVVYLAKKKRGGWASAVLAMAGWVKLYPFVLFPFLWRRFGWRAIWPGALMGVLLAAPFAAPYVLPNVKSSLDLYARLFEFNAGFYYSVKELFFLVLGPDATGGDWSKQIGPALRVLFLAGLPILYILDARYRWPLARAFLVAIGFFLVMATTVHPWYLLSLLLLAVLLKQPAWHWYWLGLLSIGTYLLYVGGPYWAFVVIGWGGWLVLVVIRHAPGTLQGLQRYRSRRKFQFICPYLPRLKKPLAVLDLGAGEGYVGEAVEQAMQTRVMLADVVPMNRTALPHVVYDGEQLPFDDDAFDVTMLYFVLHHTADQEQVFQEAMRVSSGRVIVVESVYKGTFDKALLTVLDKLANRLRSGGLMTAQEEHLHFRTAAAWRDFFTEQGAEVLTEQRRGRWIHKQALFVVKPDEKLDEDLDTITTAFGTFQFPLLQEKIN